MHGQDLQCCTPPSNNIHSFLPCLSQSQVVRLRGKDELLSLNRVRTFIPGMNVLKFNPTLFSQQNWCTQTFYIIN